ncbi:transferase family [Trichoderma arundinaceum]|uniref:Transferase family n=1 Tax=Trichoderma arundinaceum TaxID=490622 RepID=A0A395NKK9_TRIAR|nr:transferase family [Trichoderma arundinaceum]
MTPLFDYGKRLLPQILDDLALSEPDRIVYSVAKCSDISQGFQKVSARALAKAVDKTAWWLHNQVGKSTVLEAVGYIGPHDLRYVLLTYACIKAGYKVLFLSPKNSTAGALAVLEAAKCNIWVQPHGQPRLPLLEELLHQRHMNLLDLPSANDLLDAETTEPYLYNKTFHEAAQEPVCVLHTSGSTGLPKPIEWSHALIGTMDAVRLLPPTEGDNGMLPWTSDWKDGDRLYSSFPMSHGAGILMDIIIPSLYRLHCVMGPEGVIPNVSLVDSLADYGEIDIWSMVPSLVDELGETPDVLAKFKSSKFICASGGPVSPTSASKVNEVIRVLNLTGTTEGLFIGNLVVQQEDWLYFAFHPYSGFDFREVEPGVYEHWVQRNQHWALFQGIFHTFPSLDEINLKDLYIKHPSKPNLWAYKGRSDDIIVLSNGIKISPLDTEAFITTHSSINGCLMVGTGKPQVGLLIELKDPSTANQELYDSIWLTVEEANAMSLDKDQLRRDFIMFAEADKPFVRTDKGTVKRQATMKLYAGYIDKFYSIQLGDLDMSLSMKVDITSIDSVISAVRQIFSSLSPAFEDISVDANLFSLGLDSLLVVQAMRTLRAAMGLKELLGPLGPRHLYANPTIAKLSSALAKLAETSRASNGNGAALDERSAKMREILSRYDSSQSLKLNGFDMLMPNVYIQMLYYIPLRKGVSFSQAFTVLQRGLARTFALLPALDAQIAPCPEDEAGYKKGQLRMVFPVFQDGDPTGYSPNLRQLLYKDLSHTLPSFEELRNAGFTCSAFRDDLVLAAPRFAPYPVDVTIAQANFVKGGCLLAVGFHHTCLDGAGALTAARAWGESCKYVEGDTSATCGWLDPDSMNHGMLQALWKHEGYARPVQEIDPAVWEYVAQLPEEKKIAVKSKALRHPELRMFKITSQSLQRLRQEVATDLAAKGLTATISDIVQAVLWRAMLKARYHAAKRQGKPFEPDAVSVLELPIDGRPHFSPLLSPTYMGNVIVISRPSLPIETLCSPETGLGQIALLIRETTACVSPQLVHDAFGLLQRVPDFTQVDYVSKHLSVEGLDTMLSNMVLFQASDMPFGGSLFENEGVPDAIRPLIDGSNTSHRMCFIPPIRKDGGIEFVLGVFPEELESMMKDEEFTKYATYVG